MPQAKRSAPIAAQQQGLPVSTAWAEASAAVVANLDEDDLPQRLLDALATIGPFEFACMFVYRGKANPIRLHDTFHSPAQKVGLRNYSNSTYVLNPFYAAYLRGLPTGAYRMRDLAPDGYVRDELEQSYKATVSHEEEIGYLTHGWPAGMEELCLMLRMPDGDSGEISLSRRTAAGGFTAADAAAFGAITPFITAALARYWPRVRSRHLATTKDSGADAAFDRFGDTVLSPREREVAQLLLRGHSSASISAQLEISGTTVKTHRKNLYAKLGIATQYELFSLFLRSLREPTVEIPR
jgi:DNA-binding CsgD family transcriptional regulator